MKRTLVLVLALLLLVTALPAMGESELNYDAPIVMWLPGNGGVSGLEEGDKIAYIKAVASGFDIMDFAMGGGAGGPVVATEAQPAGGGPGGQGGGQGGGPGGGF